MEQQHELATAKEHASYWKGAMLEAQRRGLDDIAARARAEYEAAEQRTRDLLNQKPNGKSAIDEAVTVWLGDAADDLTGEQMERFVRIWDGVDGRYPDEDHVRDEVLSAAVQYLLGETTLESAAARLTAARASQRVAMEAGKQVALMAIEDGMDEQEAAKVLGVARKTMRRAAGKDD